MNQRTLRNTYLFEGKGLHTGKYSHMAIGPAPAGTGLRFRRTDLGEDAIVEAVADNVSKTARSTTISKGRASVSTIEHVLSALTGLGVDNALVQIDGPEAPILDGSARQYVERILADGLEEQDAPRKWVEITEEIEVSNPKSGSYIKIVPSDEPVYDLTIDFQSKVIGIQNVIWNGNVNYASEIAPCRTFCFLHEIIKLATFGLIKGGSLDNAIVIVEKPASERSLRRIAKLLGQPLSAVNQGSYLGSSKLRFDDECGRHKMLDLIGDLRLAGGFIKGKVVAYKPGHKINTAAALKIRNLTK